MTREWNGRHVGMMVLHLLNLQNRDMTGIVKKIKSKLLTKLFVEWVKESKDIEALQFSKELISNRMDVVDNRTRVIGFRASV